MSSTRCPECFTEVSNSEPACPKCNFPISKLRGLSAAILTKNAHRVAGLIQLGADVNAVDTNGRTPLMIAASIGSNEVVEMLLAAGARPEFMNAAGQTAVSIAKSREVERIIRRAIVVSRFTSLQKSAPQAVSTPIQAVQTAKTEDSQQTHNVERDEIETLQLESAQEVAIQETETLQTQIAAEMPIKDEPALEFDDSLKDTEVSAWENRIENLSWVKQQTEQIQNEVMPMQTEEVTAEELFRFPIVAASNEAAPIDLQLNEEIFETTADDVYSPEVIPSNSVAQEMQSEFSDREPMLGRPPSEHFLDQEFEQVKKPRYFVPAMIGVCLLILFMVLTWPRSSKSSVLHAALNLKPVKQITKIQPEKPQPVQEIKIPVHEEPKVVDQIPQPEVKTTALTSSSKQKLSAVVQDTTPMGDQAKIRLGRALNSQGFRLIKLGRPGDAIPLLEKSLRSFPKGTKDVHYAYAMFNLGVAWRKAGRPDIAIPILEKRIQINNQQDVVARELNTARQQAKAQGFGTYQQ